MDANQLVMMVITAAAPFMIFRNVRIVRSPELLRQYVETSPKARRLRDSIGLEAAMEMTRKRYLPLGIAMWGVLAVIGLVTLLR